MLRPPEIEMIRQETREFTDRKTKAGQFSKVWPSGPDAGILRVKTGNDWLKQEYSKPQARKLFGNLWLEDELCILFADTNLGKSVLAVQIADSLSKAYAIEPFFNDFDEPLPVLYVDFELSAKQFETRYVCPQWGSYAFGQQFYRAEFNPEADDRVAQPDYEKQIARALENAITDTGAKVVIIDNLTYMHNNTGHAQHALPLMKSLKALKIKHQVSMLALAHTPKRNPFKPLTINDLQGSKMLINFCDSAFALGQSQCEPHTRYLKQIKQRGAKEMYGEHNVCLGRIEKHLNFLKYTFNGCSTERRHLQPALSRDQQELIKQVTALKQEGFSIREIADQLFTAKTNVARILNQLKA